MRCRLPKHERNPPNLVRYLGTLSNPGDKPIAQAIAGLNSGVTVVPSYWKMLFRAYQCSQLILAGPFALGHGPGSDWFRKEHLDIGHLWRLASPVLALAANPPGQPSLDSTSHLVISQITTVVKRQPPTLRAVNSHAFCDPKQGFMAR